VQEDSLFYYICACRYPNCANAAPLPCPVPTGKCCFYDGQCKPQCEDSGSSKCPKLPTCNVVGCTQCNATNRAICLSCNAGRGYVLNVASKVCDCLPGYTGGATCTKCLSGRVSVGGKLSAKGLCKRCAAGRVPNNDASECIGEHQLLGAVDGGSVIKPATLSVFAACTFHVSPILLMSNTITARTITPAPA
jgi:hypothetical protein